MNKIVRASLPVLILLILLGGCGRRSDGLRDFPQILQTDTLRVLTLNTSTSYFIYRDQPMGYHYDMIRDFCRQHGLTPKIIVAENSNALLQMLKNNVGDVIIYNMQITNALKDSVLYCGLQQISHQVLVQRALRNDTLLTDVTGLIGKNVTVIEDSKYRDRVVNLNNELGGGIVIDYADRDTIVVEDLIRMVSKGEIAYTVADDYLAKLNQTYFRNLDVSLPVSFDQRSSWVVRRDAPILADSLNSWFKNRTTEPTFLRIIKRYFEEAKGYLDSDRPSFRDILGPGIISPFDIYFKRYGKQSGLDWRLLASVAYQESAFETEGQSWAGAGGVMGLMPATAASLGVDGDQLFDPEINIRAGSQYLKQLIEVFDTTGDPGERLKMALAAYNGGLGHILDARGLAEKYEADKDVWEGNVEKYIQLKRLEQYYSDPVCKNGYFRGDETVNYVRDVIGRWEHYKEKVKE
jgi:Predicted soluble lytic transglycosylase fused to an ABC-type amino acid-binding protein